MKRTDQSLIEQMKITEVGIAQRKELLEFSASDLKLLTDQKLLIEENIDQIVSEFYETQTRVDEISLLIGDADTLTRLQYAQRKYVLDLFSGEYDDVYVNNRLRIGLVHKRIGVDPKLYLAGVRTLKAVISKNLRQHISEQKLLESTLDALDKLFYFDITLVFDTYIDTMVNEIKVAQRKAESYATSLEGKVAERTKELKNQAQLDPLTNIYNHRALRQFLTRALAMSIRQRKHIAIIYLDIDNFKHINDKFGHIIGDEVLKFLASILISSIRSVDFACRYGGDEFCVLLPECRIVNAKIVCEKIISKFVKKYPDYSISMGIAESDIDQAMDVDQLIQLADSQMYLAKKLQGCQISVSSK